MPARKRRSSRSKRARGKKRAAGGPQINFIPNDPGAVRSVPMRTVRSSRNRAAGRATFDLMPQPAAAGRYLPGTADFVYWQSREAALRTVAAWEKIDGPLRRWNADVGRRLPLDIVPGVEMNAFYGRNGLSFHTFVGAARTTYPGASTDVVAHEIGHALLDTIRPDLWDNSVPEHDAFHEAFGDCMALLTALADDESRQAVLRKSRDLGRAHFAEAFMEDMSTGVRLEYGKNDASALPRRARNRYQWQDPTTLPTSGGRKVLTGEFHSFSRVFTGCFYDLVRNLFRASAKKDSTSLRTAAETAGALLFEGTRNAVERLRFFQAVGEAMLVADQRMNGGANQQHVIDAFDKHGVALAMPARAFSVRTTLTTPRPAAAARAARAVARPVTSQRSVEHEVKRQLNADPGQHLQRTALPSVGPHAQKLTLQRQVPLAGMGERLKNVVATAPEPVVVGRLRGAATLRSSIPATDATTKEARFYVETLLARGSILFEGAPSKAAFSARSARGRGARAAMSSPTPSRNVITHVVRKKGTKEVLERVRFACGACARTRNEERGR